MDHHINHSLPVPGPSKKRKRNPGLQRHWDDPEQQSSSLPYDEDALEKKIEGDGAVDDAEEETESRELTQDEIWDDSALIAAWESATAEYEVCRLEIIIVLLYSEERCDKAYHGKGKDWKKETVKKSPLLVFDSFWGALADPRPQMVQRTARSVHAQNIYGGCTGI